MSNIAATLQQQCNSSAKASASSARTQVGRLGARPLGLLDVADIPDLDPGGLPADQDLVAPALHDLSVLKLAILLVGAGAGRSAAAQQLGAECCMC